MLKFTRKTLALALCAAIVMSLFTALASDGTLTLRVEGAEGNLVYEKNIPFTGQNALELVSEVLEQQEISFTAEGGYLSEIGGQEAGAFGGWDGWVYYVNGVEGATAIGECQLSEGDSLLVVYADPYDAENPTLIPQVSVETDESGGTALLFSAQLTTFDEQWNMTVTTVPVTGATVTVDGAGYVTDQNGNVPLSAADAAKAKIAVQIEKYDENGKPLVVRFVPDFTVTLNNSVSFSDMTAGSWYEEHVVQLVTLGAINGYSDGTFRPLKEVTRAEFIKILACLDENFDAEISFKSAFGDVRRSDWHAPYVMWALENGVIEKASLFYPNTALAREDMALFVYNFAVKVLDKSLDGDLTANAFADEGEISERCAEAIYLLQKAGIINGIYDGGTFVFAPKGSAQRSQAAKVIAMVYNLPAAE